MSALELRLSNERMREAVAPSELRRVWIAQIEKEIASELAFIAKADEAPMTDDELLRELGV